MQASAKITRSGNVRKTTSHAPCKGHLMTWRATALAMGMVLFSASGARAGIIHKSLSNQLSEKRQCGVATTIGTQAVFAGGMDSTGSGLSGVDIYDAATNTWSTASLSEGRLSLSATSVGTKALFAGGAIGLVVPIPSNRVDIYEGGAWSTATLSKARSHLAATSLGGQALFAGGQTSVGYSARVDIYDSASDSWSTASLSQARLGLAATTVGNQALFAGGYDGAGSNVVDIYEGGAWSTSTLSKARGHLAATTVGSVVLFGGGNTTAVVDIYDSATSIWTTGSLSQARGQLAATSMGGFAFFGGGYAAGGQSDVVDIYHVSSDTWYTAQLSVARSNLMATSVGNQAIFAGGGSGGKQVDIFEVTDTTTWTRDAGSGAGDWADNANWDSVVGPFTSDYVHIANGGTAQLAGAAQVASVTVGGGGGAGGTLQLLPGASLSAPAISVESLGILSVQQDWTYDGALTISGGDVNLGAKEFFLDAGGALRIIGSTLGADRLVVGDSDSASATQLGGTVTIGGNLQLGLDVTADGTYMLSGDAAVQLDVGAHAVMGVKGAGRFVQTGGVHTVGGELRVGRYNGAAGTYEMSDGELTVTSFGVVGYAGEGTFTQSGGTHTVGQRLVVGYGSQGVGLYELGGTGVLSARDDERIGHNGTGAFMQTSGTHQVTGRLILGSGATGNGTYTMKGGTLGVSDTLGVGDGGTGRLELQGGDVTAGDLEIGAAGTMAFTGGSLSVGSITNQGVLNWQSGTLNVTGAAGLALGPSEALGSTLTLSAAHSLHVTDEMTVPAGSTLTLGPGAGLSVGSLTNAGTAVMLTDAVDFGGGFTNTADAMFMGTTVTGPVHTPAGSTVTILQTVTFEDLVSGGGTFWGPGTVVFNGGHNPGDSPGCVTFEGNVTYGPLAQLHMELGDPSVAEDLDVIDVGGCLTLNGVLDVVLLAGYSPAPGDVFDILNWNTRVGEFDTMNLPGLDPGLAWDDSALYTTGQLQVTPEPATLAFLALGGLGLLLRRTRRCTGRRYSAIR